MPGKRGHWGPFRCIPTTIINKSLLWKIGDRNFKKILVILFYFLPCNCVFAVLLSYEESIVRRAYAKEERERPRILV